MSGPIVRTGATPEFSKNWDNIFSGAKKSSPKKKTTKAKAGKPARGKKKGKSRKK